MRQHEHFSVTEMRKFTKVPPGQRLFESYVIFQNLQSLEFLVKKRGQGKKLFDLSYVSLQVQDEHPFRLDIHPLEPMLLISFYFTDWFDSATVLSILNDYKNVLEHFAAHPECSVADLLHLPLN
jgi:hypothetical protein